MRNRLEEKGLTPEKLVEMYLMEKSILKLSKRLGMDRKTLSNYLQEAGVSVQPGRKRGFSSPKKDYHFSCLAEWLRKNPEKLLPRSIIGIVELTGCTKDEVKSYIYRRRIAVQRKVHRLPINSALGSWRSVEGKIIPFAAWEVREVKVDQSFRIQIQVDVKGSREIQHFLFPGLRQLLKGLGMSDDANW